MLFSILIATLEARRDLFAGLQASLQQQVEASGEAVEILSLCDRGEAPLGEKRNQLIEQARGEFIAFVDDDDRVSDDYVARICGTLRKNPGVDNLGLRAVITFRGSHPCRMEFSAQHREIYSKNHVYYRPPVPLNPIRREIARRYRFPAVSYSEDFHWSLRLRDDGVLRREAMIEPPLYFYLSRRWWPYQWTLDATEGVRHKLGLTMVNRLRWNRSEHAGQNG